MKFILHTIKYYSQKVFKLEQSPTCAHFTAIFPFHHLKPSKKTQTLYYDQEYGTVMQILYEHICLRQVQSSMALGYTYKMMCLISLFSDLQNT